MNKKRSKLYVCAVALVAIGITGCTSDPFDSECDEKPVAIPDIQLPNGEIDSSYVVEIFGLVSGYGIKSIGSAENLDVDSLSKYGIYVGDSDDGNYRIMGNSRIAGKNITFRIRITENPKLGCNGRQSVFKAVIPEIK